MKLNLKRTLNRSTPSSVPPSLPVAFDRPMSRIQSFCTTRSAAQLYSLKRLSNPHTQSSYVLRNIRFRLQPRTYVIDTNKHRNASEQALIDELHRLSHRQEDPQPILGPFAVPRGKVDEKPLRVEEFHHWSRVGWTERIRRAIRMGRNLMIVSFGSCLAILVVYSITSELLAPSSGTNLMNMTIKLLEESDELKKVLKSPIRFHTTPIQFTGGNSITPKRTSGIPQSIQRKNGTLELRFWVESHKPSYIEGDWRSLKWWKGWIGPLMTSEVSHHQPGSSPDENSSESNPNARHLRLSPQSAVDDSAGWWPGLLKSVMPNTFGLRQSSTAAGDQRTSWSQRFFSSHDSFEHGEVIAELIKESDGQWKYKSLIIDFPDSQNVAYRLNLSKELRRKQNHLLNQATEQKEEQVSNAINPSSDSTRYRFWNRRISA